MLGLGQRLDRRPPLAVLYIQQRRVRPDSLPHLLLVALLDRTEQHVPYERVVSRWATALDILTDHVHQPSLESLPRGVEPRAHCACVYAEEAGDFALCVPVQVVQRRRHPLGFRQRADGLGDAAPEFLRFSMCIGTQRRGADLSRHHQGHDRQTLPPRHPVALRADDAPKPPGKCVGIPDVLEPSPRDNECLLSCVLGQVRVSKEGVGVAVRHVLVATDDLLERADACLDRRIPCRSLSDEDVDGDSGPPYDLGVYAL